MPETAGRKEEITMVQYVGGIDIGGTKCAVSIGKIEDGSVSVVEKRKIPTPDTPQKALSEMIRLLQSLLEDHPTCKICGIGISCGGPLDSEKGLIQAPPNLPNWDGIDVITPFEETFHVPTALQNDANACALAEWMWGAGKGSRNMIFLTFGTGMGAGLILNGKLYAGTNDMAGEVGHMRLEQEGPVGYGKPGSFEGFCSGGGIGRQASALYGREMSAQELFERAEAKEEQALSLVEKTAQKLGMGLSILIDVLNPQKIVIGSIFLRQENQLRPCMEEIIRQEALSYSAGVCEIVPAGLGESLGDYAAYSVAMNALE